MCRNSVNKFLTSFVHSVQLILKSTIKELSLQNNQIRDITPLANLIQIEKLYLQHNMIVDLKPLVDNLGLVNKNPVHLEGGFDWQADVVGIHDNPLSEVSRNVYIPALEARGVIVRQ